MEGIEFVKTGEIYNKCMKCKCNICSVKLTVDIQLGDTVYKDATITIPEDVLEYIVSKYETSHNWS